MTPHTRPSMVDDARGSGVLEAGLVYGAVAFLVIQAFDLVVSQLLLGALTQLVLTWIVSVAALLWVGVSWRFGVAPWPEQLPYRPMRVALGLLIGGLLIAGFKPRITSNGLAAGVDRIAVLPFSVEGQGMGHLREGVADLFAHALDEVGGIRVVDPAGVLNQWRNATPTEREGLTLGPGFILTSDAASVLRGTLQRAETGLVLRAVLWSVEGDELASVEVAGTLDGISALVDEAGARLLRAVWRSRDRPPGINIESVTTGEPEALESYLRGEAYLRRAQWGAAARAFREAVGVDPAFALAHARLASALAWGTPQSAHADPVVRASVAAASRLLERLPARYRTPTRAWAMWDDGNVEGALELMGHYLDAYPSSRDGWQLVSEITFHDGLGGRDNRARFLAIADRVLELDPSFAPGFLHPLQVTLADERTVFFDYLNQAEESRFTDVLVFRALGGALWDAPQERSAVVQSAWGVQPEAAERVVSSSFGTQVGSPEDFLGGLKSLVGTLPPGPDERAWRGHAAVLTSLGRLGAASDTSWARDIPRPTRDRTLLLQPALAGYVTTVPTDVIDSLGAGWAISLVQMQLELNRGDVDAARWWADSLDLDSVAEDDALLRRRIVGLAEAGRGWAQLIEGDTAGAVVAMRSGLTQASLWGADLVRRSGSDPVAELSRALWFRLVASMASSPPTRELAITLLEDTRRLGPFLGAPLDFHYAVLSHLELGRAYERAGRMNEARGEFEWFVRLLNRADRGLAIDDEIAEARSSLVRLAEG